MKCPLVDDPANYCETCADLHQRVRDLEAYLEPLRGHVVDATGWAEAAFDEPMIVYEGNRWPYGHVREYSNRTFEILGLEASDI